MTRVENALRFARRLRAMNSTQRLFESHHLMARHLLALAKEFERIQVASIRADIELAPEVEQ